MPFRYDDCTTTALKSTGNVSVVAFYSLGSYGRLVASVVQHSSRAAGKDTVHGSPRGVMERTHKGDEVV
ncbi:hypothetical protein O3P69_011104 [Scylla paramamosain]|uniref:Uncharacterized protein n=1 Tax=Scylla paramamosain TaxID=85552 RepID=A0AAW0STP8_SCYPA